MARWFIRRGGRFYRRGRVSYGRYRRGWRYRRGGYGRRYINATSRSGIRIRTNITQTYNKTSGYGDTLGTLYHLRPLANANDSVTASPLYQNYVNLYEECKLIGMKIAVSIITPVGGAALPSLQIYSCFDRRHGYGEPEPTADDIRNMATMTCATALNNNVAKITRSIYASDLLEKAQWVDSDPVSAANASNQAWVTAARNPNFFCPSFHMCFGSPSLTQETATNVSFSVSITYYVAFRNPKYGGSSSSRDLPLKDPGMPDDDDGDLDAAAEAMDVSETQALLPSAADVGQSLLDDKHSRDKRELERKRTIIVTRTRDRKN